MRFFTRNAIYTLIFFQVVLHMLDYEVCHAVFRGGILKISGVASGTGAGRARAGCRASARRVPDARATGAGRARDGCRMRARRVPGTRKIVPDVRAGCRMYARRVPVERAPCAGRARRVPGVPGTRARRVPGVPGTSARRVPGVPGTRAPGAGGAG